MTYRFKLHGKRFRHSWEKECERAAALVHAKQVARECAKDGVYAGSELLVTDAAGQKVASLAVSDIAKAGPAGEDVTNSAASEAHTILAITAQCSSSSTRHG